MQNFFDRPRRHRIVAVIWRAFAVALFIIVIFGEGPGAGAQWMTMFALLFLAVLHDLVAAAVQMRTRIEWRTITDGTRSISEGSGGGV